MMRGRAVWMRAAGLCCAAAMMVGVAGCASKPAPAPANGDAAAQAGAPAQSDDAGSFLCDTDAFEEVDPGQTHKDGDTVRLRKKSTGLEFSVPYEAKTPHLYYEDSSDGGANDGWLYYSTSCEGVEFPEDGEEDIPSLSFDVGGAPENYAELCNPIKRDDQGRITSCGFGDNTNYRFAYGHDGTAYEVAVFAPSEVADGLDPSVDGQSSSGSSSSSTSSTGADFQPAASQSLTYKGYANENFQIKVTVNVTGWMDGSDTGKLQSAWKAAGGEDTFDFSGLGDFSTTYGTSGSKDSAVLIGTVTYEYLTPGEEDDGFLGSSQSGRNFASFNPDDSGIGHDDPTFIASYATGADAQQWSDGIHDGDYNLGNPIDRTNLPYPGYLSYEKQTIPFIVGVESLPLDQLQALSCVFRVPNAGTVTVTPGKG